MYDYNELKNNALKPNAKQDDINALGEWFEQYGDSYWNGEYFEIDSEHRLYPQYKEIDEDEFEITGYEIK
ncbi:MAG: hypothetical protein ACI4HO_02070 [Ruminococcus sp.]